MKIYTSICVVLLIVGCAESDLLSDKAKRFIKTFLFLAFWIVLVGCGKRSSTEQIIKNSILNISKADTINTFEIFAECQSQKGNYTTEIHSGKDDYTYFKQVYSYGGEPFEAVVFTLDSGFQINQDSTFTSLPRVAINIIKGHEFHEILFDLSNRFHQFGEPELVPNSGMYKITALDELNNPVEIFFDTETMLLEAMTIRNPDKIEEIIRIKYSNRKQIQGMLLPMHLEILQGDQKFIFDFTTIKINAKGFREYKKG